METFMTNILVSYGDIGILIMFLFYKSKQLEKIFDKKHDQALNKLDKMAESSANIEKKLAVFSTKLDHGDSRFLKIEDDLSLLRARQHKLSEEIHIVMNKQVTKEHVELMIDSKIS